MSVRVKTTTLLGAEALPVEVEADLVGSIKKFSIVGLPDGIVKEAKERVKCSIMGSGYQFPRGELIVSLAPANLPKLGSGFDLAIAVSILAGSGVVPLNSLEDKVFIGELALDGRIKPVPGILSTAALIRSINNLKGKKESKEAGTIKLITSERSANEAALIEGVEVFGAKNLIDVVNHLSGTALIEQRISTNYNIVKGDLENKKFLYDEIIGQFAAKRALQIVAAGGHNLLMVGPPGGGKTMMATALTSILPELDLDDLIEVSKLHSISRQSVLGEKFYPVMSAPFRAPHHSTSLVGLIGGGALANPGEISLAHKGVLFLDELPEFKREAIDSLRQPLESGEVMITRAKLRVKYPADFILVAAMNPCPCGKRGIDGRSCVCGDNSVRGYQAKISEPILDRIDLQVWIDPTNIEDIMSGIPNRGEAREVLEKIKMARQRQRKRLKKYGKKINSEMSTAETKEICKMTSEASTHLERYGKLKGISPRSFMKIIKIAQTIRDLKNIDLEGCYRSEEGRAGSKEGDFENKIELEDISEALSYRVSIKENI